MTMGTDDLVERLRREGDFVADGTFELDRQNAREKLGEYQLTDPHHYVLHLVQAAHLLGAEHIDFDIDANEMEMRVDDASLTRANLEELYDAALSERADRKTRALRHLAIALATAREMELSEVRVEVTKSGETTALVHADGVRADDERFEEFESPDTSDGTRVYLREASRASHLTEFFQNLAGNLAEKSALREYCKFSERHISLDGEIISFGHRLPDQTVGHMAIQTDYERGKIGLVPDDKEVRVVVLQNGVRIAGHFIKADLCGARAVIESDRLTMNLSQSALIEDDHWKHVLEKLIPAAIYAALRRYIQVLEAPYKQTERVWLQNLCAQVLSQNNDHQRPDLSELDLAQPGEELPDIDTLLHFLPLWQYVDPSTIPAAQEYIALDAVEKPTRYTRQFRPNIPAETLPPALYLPSGPPDFFKFVLATRFIDLTRKYRPAYKTLNTVEQTRANNIRGWSMRSWDDGPGSSSYPIQQHFGASYISARLALARKPRNRATLKLVKAGRLFGEYRFNSSAGSPSVDGDVLPPGLVIWFGGDLPINRLFNALEPNADFILVAKDLVTALPAFIMSHAHLFEPIDLQRFLAHFLTGKVDTVLCRTLGISEPRQWLNQVTRDLPESPWALVYHLQERCHWAGLAPDEVVDRVDQLGELARTPLFETARGEAISLGALAGIYAQEGQIDMVVGGYEEDEAPQSEGSLASQVRLATLGRHGQIALEKLFGKPGAGASTKKVDK
jgi:hypothetical protein